MIPLHKPTILGNQLSYLLEASTSSHISSDGAFTHQCREFFKKELDVYLALMTTSCTHALEAIAILLDIKPHDEVILPAFTFTSTANAFLLRGAIPVFADISLDTLTIDPASIEPLITQRTRAIIVMHYAGIACDLSKIIEIAKTFGIPVIEDNAHGLFGKYRGRYLGTFGTMSALSFHQTKNFSCGEGGAIIINDELYAQRAETISEKGTNRSQFLRGEVDKYTWIDIGSSYLMSDILAAYLWGQLENFKLIQQKRMQIWNTYVDCLKEWAEQNDVRLPNVPDECEPAYHLFYLVMPSMQSRDALMYHLRNQNIQASFHYMPLDRSPYAVQMGYDSIYCKNTSFVSERLLRIPFYYDLRQKEQDKVIEAIFKFNFPNQL